MSLKKYWKELQRRHVVKAGIAYLVFTWLLTQVFSILLPVFDIPTSVFKTLIIVMAVGFPIWLIFAWVYDFTPDGLQKTKEVEFDSKVHARKNVKLNRFIIGTLSLAVVLLIVNQIRMKNEMTEIKSVTITSPFEESIAVMAFSDMSPNKDHEYFSDGISEELLNILVKIPKLKVISRTSSFSFKNKEVTAKEIGEQLEVSHLLEGSIRKAGNTVRITAQLVNTKDGSHVWSQTYDRNLDSIFKIQDEIAREVSNQLQLTLMGSNQLQSPPATEAYNLYLHSKHLLRQNTKESLINAEKLVMNSLEIDSTYSPAWDLWASISMNAGYNFSIGEAKDQFAKGLVAAKRAIELDPNSADAYATLAALQNLTWDFEASAENMDKALKLKPYDALILGSAALYTFGDLEKGVELINTAIKIDPLLYLNYYNLGFHHYRLNNLDEAQAAFDKFAIYYPNSQILHYMNGLVLLAKGDVEGAAKEMEQETHEFFSLYGKNFLLFAQNKKEESDLAFQEFLDKYSESDLSNTADLYAYRGNTDKAFEYLNRAYEEKDAVLIEAMTYPSFKPLKKDPRWQELLSKMNLPDGHKLD